MPYDERLPTMKAFHLAAFNGHDQEVQSLIGVDDRDVNIPDDTGRFAVVRASMNGHETVVRILLDGADVNAQDSYYGHTIQAACSEGYDKIVQLLLERGADVNAQDGDGANVL